MVHAFGPSRAAGRGRQFRTSGADRPSVASAKRLAASEVDMSPSTWVEDPRLAEAVVERDLAYRGMRRAVPDLDRPEVERGALTNAQALTVARYFAAEDRVRALRMTGTADFLPRQSVSS